MTASRDLVQPVGEPSDSADAAEPALRVAVVYALPDQQYLVELRLRAGATVTDALAAVAGREPFSALDLQNSPVGIFGEPVGQDRLLADHDRVEIYRPLRVDPVEARRRRSQAGRERGSGTQQLYRAGSCDFFAHVAKSNVGNIGRLACAGLQSHLW